jgi:hypothetical protein
VNDVQKTVFLSTIRFSICYRFNALKSKAEIEVRETFEVKKNSPHMR